MINYVTEDGEVFTDKKLYMKHQHELYMKKLEIINKRSWIDSGLHWIILIVFFAGYLFGIFLNPFNK